MTENYDPTKEDKLAIGLIQREKQAWENINIVVSDDVTFSMRGEIDSNRKNYYGVYENSVDDDTGLDKLWIPLTEWTIETIVKNIDLDTKDVTIKNPPGKDARIAQLVRLVTLHFLKIIGFGEFLNEFTRSLTIDGTGIAKAVRVWSKEYKRNLPRLSIVDPLNLVIDPSAHSLHDVPILQKASMTKDEVARMPWDNKEFIQYSTGSVPTANIYERWGLIPKSLVTKDKADEETWLPGTIIASAQPKESTDNVSSSTGQLADQIKIIHKIKLDKGAFKPFEECWYKRVPNRWHGRPPAEMIKGLQTWLNTVVNIRRDELMNKLTGKFKYRKGVGITRQMLESIKSGGAIPVDNMEDIQTLVEGDVKASAYQEPAEIIGMAERVTGTHDVETIAPSLPATTAVLKDRGSRSAFALTQENIGLFLKRFLKRHVIPLIIDSLKQGEILRITGEAEDLLMIDDIMLTNAYHNEVLNRIVETGRVPTDEEAEMFKTAFRGRLNKLGKDRDIQILKEFFDVDYDVDIEITDEKFDKAVMARNLIDLIQAQLPGMDGEALGREVAEIMGLSGSRFTNGQKTPAATQVAGREPTAMSEFQRGNLEGTLSPKTKGVPVAAATQQ